MQNRRIQFTNHAGLKLAGLIDNPASETRAWALFAHCFTCSKNLKAATHIVQALNDAGIGVLRFDFTGLGQSEGDFADTSFSSNVSDLVDAARWLEREYEAPAILLGHSLGGTAVLRAAREIPSAVAIATIGSPAEPSHVRHLFGDSLDELEREGSAEVNIGGRPFRVTQEFVEDLEDHDLLDDVSQLRRSLLVMHAPLDAIVEIDNASALFIAAKHPKSFVSLDDADHLLTRSEDSQYAGAVLAAWASKYLPEPAGEALTATPVEVAARTFTGSFRTEIVSGQHRLLKGLDLTSATVRVQHGKTHARDCDDCETKDGKVDEFLRELSVEGNLSDAERTRLVEIADRCPVHRTLHSEVKVRTHLAD